VTWVKPLGISPGGGWATTAGLAIGASVLAAMAALTILVSAGQAHATAHHTGGGAPTTQSAEPTTPRVPVATPPVTPPAYAAVGPWQVMQAQPHPTPPAPAGLNPTTIHSADPTTPPIPIAIPRITATPYGGEGP
jgi:hypothetical protein